MSTRFLRSTIAPLSAALVCGLALAAPAEAREWRVRTAAELKRANAGAATGDVVRLSGRIAAPIAPARPGVRYVGPAVVGGLSLTQDDTVVERVTALGTLFAENAKGIVVRNVTVSAGKLEANQMVWLVRRVRNATFDRVVTTATLTSEYENRGRCFYETSHSVIRDCRTVLEYSGPENGAGHAQFLRDRSNDNLFERDTLLAGTRSPREWARMIMLATSGSHPGTSPRNTFRECVYVGTGMIYLQDNVSGWKLENSAFRSGQEFRTNRLDDVTIENCVFVTDGTQAFIEDARGSSGRLRNNVFAARGQGRGSPLATGSSLALEQNVETRSPAKFVRNSELARFDPRPLAKPKRR
jgi:hypothetical protein